MKPDISFVLKSGHFHLLTTLPVSPLLSKIAAICLTREKFEEADPQLL